jgi:arylsulfatase A-like enzyme
VALLFGGLLYPTTADAVGSSRPNVLLIVTDDQTTSTVGPEAMPNTYRWMVLGGRAITNFTIDNPLCCPSRVTILSGRHSHNTHQIDNREVRIDEAATIECYLHGAGFRTGLFGKFLQGWPMWQVHTYPPYYRLPMCVDGYAINGGGQHAGLRFLDNGRLVRPAGYTDDYTTSRAQQFLRASEAHDSQPWFMYFAPTYPHGPYIPRPEHRQDILPVPPRSPAIHENVSDKPDFVRAHQTSPLPVWNPMLQQGRMLETVDEEIGRLFSTLVRQHEAANTIIIYVSDNGMAFGEHGLFGKALPYPPVTRVPFFIRWPDHIAAGTTGTRFASNIDITPTILDATGVHPRLIYPLDGRSLLRPWSSHFAYSESWTPCFTYPHTPCNGAWRPNWSSIRTPWAQYSEWRRRGVLVAREYYNLVGDPNELTNLFGDGNPANDPARAAQRLASLLATLRRCAGTACPR